MRAFRFGVIADVQYADADPGWDFHHIQQRCDLGKKCVLFFFVFLIFSSSFYRHSRVAMQEAIGDFNGAQVDFVLQLGDLIGENKTRNRGDD